ncbi:hypothetical protein CQA53_12065, partial [Helicobacter didelphidarum]
MKMSYSILSIIGILVVAVMFSGCVSTRFFDPQYYEFKRLAENYGGGYVVEPELYEDINKNGIHAKLSNGYYLSREPEKV